MHILISQIFLACNLALSQSVELGLPFINTYYPKTYGGEAQCWSLTHGPLGRIFVANGAGILQFDGINWKLIKANNEADMLSIASDSSGNLFAGGDRTFGRLVYDKSGQLQYRSLLSLLPDEVQFTFVRRITPYGDKIYFQSDEVLIVYDYDTLVATGKDKQLLGRHFLIDDRLLFTSERGIYSLDKNEQWQLLPGSPFFGDKEISSILKYNAQSLLISTFHYGLFIYRNGEVSPYRTAADEYFKGKMLTAIMELDDGKLVLGGVGTGIYILEKNGQIQLHLNKALGLSNDVVYKFFSDNSGSLWVATGNGITRIEMPMLFTRFNLENGMESTIQTIIRHQGKMYAGCESGIYLLNRGRKAKSDGWKNAFFTRTSDSPLEAWDFETLEGQLFAAMSSGVVKIGDEITDVSPYSARCLYKSKVYPNRIYVGRTDGLGYFEVQNDRIIDSGHIAGNVQVRSIAENPDGNLWLGLLVDGVQRVLFSREDTLVIEYGEEEPLIASHDNEIFNIGNEIIFATPNGLLQYHEADDRFERFTGFGDRFSDGSRWIYRMAQTHDQKAIIHSYNLTETVVVKKNEGNYPVKGNPFRRLGYFPVYAIYPEENGIIWLGGPEGLIRYDRRGELPQPGQFSSVISKVLVAEDSMIYASSLMKPEKMALPFALNTIRFELGVANFLSPEGLNFQYKLEGFEKDWSAWLDDEIKYYTNLDPGDYTFNGRAKDIYGNLSEPAQVEFEILPPWYGTWWFILIVTLIILIFIVLIVKYISQRKLIRRVEELELIKQVNDERGRISRDIHDHVGSNLTYIIANLDHITYESRKKASGLSEKVDKLSNYTRNTMNELRDTIWHLNQEKPTSWALEKKLNEITSGYDPEIYPAKVEIISNVEKDTELLPAVGLNLFRICQEALNNAMKHARADKATIYLQRSGPQNISIQIKDDGCGFDVTDKCDGHYGIANMHKRAAEIDGELVIKSAPGQGTTIKITAPIKK